MNPTRSSKPAMRHFLAPIGAVVPVEPAVTLADGTTTTSFGPSTCGPAPVT